MSIDVEAGYSPYLTGAARRWPDRIGLRFEGRAWTYSELEAAADTAARRLAGAGISSGTRVLLLMENCPEYLIAQFALARLGAVFVTPNPYWTATEMAHAAEASSASAAIHLPRWAAVAARLDISVPLAELLEDRLQDLPAEPIPIDPVAPLYIPFSSGTTGLPKGVVHTAASLVGGIEQLRRHVALSERDTVQISLPLCHIFGATMSAAAIAVGAEMTLFRRFDLDESLRHIREAAVTIWPLAGAVAHRLAQREDLCHQDFASLRLFMWGGSAVPLDLADDITTRTGIRFLCSYGMTEAMMVAFNPIDRPGDWRLDSPGYATDGTEFRLAPNGELEVRGPSVAAGYAGEASAAFAPDGWFRTGDIATLDPDGRLNIVDRAKDMLKVSGFQVAPTEVEQALLAHPDVVEAAVVGRPDTVTGESPVAFIVGRNSSPSADALHGWLRGRLSSYKLPRDYRFVDALPRTASGKVRRAELRDTASAPGTDQPKRS